VSLNEWAEKITMDVYDAWKSKFPWDPGFKVFYSPVYLKPQIVVVGHNPGGGEQAFTEDKQKFERGNFSLPLVHEYICENYPIAKKMRNFFEGNLRLLETSVKFNLFFFRSKDIEELGKMDTKLKNEMKKFCYNKFLEIINFLKPKMIILEGLATYDIINKNVVQFSSESNFVIGKRRLASMAMWGDIFVYGIVHPTGCRIRRDEWNKLREKLNAEICKLN